MKNQSSPIIYLISGPNGAGKTTCAFSIMPELLDCYEYVNTDAIAAGLSPFRPEGAYNQARFLLSKRISLLGRSGATFAVETTLATKSLLRSLWCWKQSGYSIRLFYIWLNSYKLALARIRQRVATGGLNAVESMSGKQYVKEHLNSLRLLMNVADSWMIYDNSAEEIYLIAQKSLSGKTKIHKIETWNFFKGFGIE